MALNIGSLVGYLELDDRNFTRKADQAEKKIVGLKSSLEALAKSDPKLKLRVDAETAKLDEIHARLTELKAQAARGIDVRVETAKAMAELAALDARIRSMPDVEVKTDKAIGNVRALGVAIAMLGPTIGPVAASATGMSVALGSVFLAGAGGIALYAAAAKSAVKGALDQQKALEAAQKRLAKAKTPEGKASARKQLAELQALNAEQARFIKGRGAMSSAWEKLTTSKATFRPLVAGMTVLTAIIPKLRPLLDAVSKSLTGAIEGIGKWVDSGSFDRFVKGFSQLAGPSITIGLRTLGNFAKGFGGMGKAFGPLGLQMASSIERVSASFAKWGNNSAGLQQFVEYVSTEGPKILHTLGDVISAVVHLGIATAPAGGAILTVLSGIAKGISMIPVPVLVPLASGLIAVNLALKALAVTTAAANALGMERTAMALGNMSKLKFAGVAMGLGAVAASATSSNKALGILGSAAGGALMGFQVGGPWGAAIGAGAGALVGLWGATRRSAKAMDDSVPDADALAQSLRGVAGAATDAARAQEIVAARKNGTLKTGQSIGLSPRQVADAALGNPAAQAAAQRASEQYLTRLKARMDEAKASFDALMNNPDRSPEAVQQIYAADKAAHLAANAYRDGAKAIDAFGSHLGAAAGNARGTREQIWLTQQVTATYAKNLKKLPPEVQTKINLRNVAPTLGDIAKLARHYKLTPKQIETLLKATGIDGADGALAKIDKLIKKQGDVRPLVRTKVSADTSGALSAIHNVQTLMNTLSHATSTVTVKGYTYAPQPHVAPKSGTVRANGGRISGPGSGTSDSIVANVSNGEFIVNAAATKRHLPLLAAINAGSFASGGRVNAKKKAAARKHDQSLLDQYLAQLSKTDTRISDARGFGAAFAGNAFAQGFTGASSAMGPASVVNGSMVSTSTGPSATGILSQMFAYQAGQLKQAKTLNADVARLRKMGVSRTLIAQMQAAGASGVSQIHALAGGSAAEVKRFNNSAVATQKLLNDAGAVATTGASMNTLQRQRANEHSIVKGIREAIKDGVKVHVVHGHVRPV